MPNVTSLLQHTLLVIYCHLLAAASLKEHQFDHSLSKCMGERKRDQCCTLG